MRHSPFRTYACSLAAVLFALSLTPHSFAQTVATGELTGTVLDPTGAVVRDASVVLKSVETGESRLALSNAAGVYRFTFVRPGMYDIRASSPLLVGSLQVIVSLGQVFVANLSMKIEQEKQDVIVRGTPLLDSENAQSTYTLSSRQIDLLPLPGGDLVGVAYSAPGVVIANRRGNGGSFAFQGIGSVSNLFTFNGADEMDPYQNLNNSGTTGLLLGANEIQEASVIQNPFAGQYGRAAGAQVNYVSKSGSNSFHGNLAYTYNGTVLNANDYFNNAEGIKRPHTVSNQYAAAFGGPIRRDKLFFFLDTEGLRYALPGSASIVAVPSKALEQYSLNTVQPSQVPLYRQAFSLYDAALGRAGAVPVINGTSPLQDSAGQLGCGQLAGTPTGFGGTFGTNVSCADAYPTIVASDTSEWLASARLDYNLSSKQHLFLRFKTDHGMQATSTSAISPVFNAVSTEPDYEAQLNHTFSITPRLANNFIAAMSYYSYVFTFADPAGAVAAFPFRFNFSDGGSNGSLGITPMGAPARFPNGDRAVNLQFVDDVSYATGNHSLSAGINYRHTRETDFQFAAFNKIGRFNFTDLRDFAAGALNANSGSTYFQQFPTTPILHLRLYNLGFYFQDEWAIRPNLKLTGTIRVDVNGNPYCLEHCFARLTSPFAQLTKGPAIPYNQSIETGVANAYYDVDPPAIQPRVSVAYSPEWVRGTVIRAGVGIFSDLYPAYFDSALVANAPTIFSSLIRTGLVNVSGTGSAPAISAASAAAFQNGFANGATLAQLHAAVAPAQFAPPNFFSVPGTLSTPKFVEWSAEVERQLGNKNVVSLRYAGNHGYDLLLQNNLENAATNTRNFPNGFGGLPLATPDPRFAVIHQLTNAGYSNYEGLTARVRRSLHSNLEGQISYTWSHSLDSISNGGLSQFAYDSLNGQINPLDLHSLNYSSSDYDVRHNLALDFVWDLPTHSEHRGFRSLLGGWSIAGKANAHSGMPFTVSNSVLSGRAATNFGGTVLAVLIDPSAQTSCGRAAVTTPCLTAAQFATATTQVTFGNVPRNSFRGPGYVEFDSALYKEIGIHEQTRFRVGLIAFNVFNHPNFLDPNGNVASPGLGLITLSANPPSGPYGSGGGPQGRTVVLTGKIAF